MAWFDDKEEFYLAQQLEKEGNSLDISSRRHFIKNSLSFLAGSASIAALPNTVNAQTPPNIPKWTRSLGRGVVSVPYGQPSKYQKYQLNNKAENSAMKKRTLNSPEPKSWPNSSLE